MADVPVIGPVAAPELHVMTFNIRRRFASLQRNDDLWARRRAAVRRLLRSEGPAIIGLQECLPAQTKFVASVLRHHHDHVGFGRNADHGGEQCPLFWDTRRLKLDSWEQLALSATPTVPGSRSWGNITPRIAVVAQFTDLATKQQFQFINTHLDNASRTARVRGAQMLTQLAVDKTTIITGDFNSSVGTTPYSQLTLTGAVVDTWFTAEDRVTDDWGSFPNYGAPRLARKRIDWILASRGVTVSRAAINPSRYDGIAPSDHLAVQAVVAL